MPTKRQAINAIEQFLGLGESTLGKGHEGYFSGGGWAATTLRDHLRVLEIEALEEKKPKLELDKALVAIFREDASLDSLFDPAYAANRAAHRQYIVNRIAKVLVDLGIEGDFIGDVNYPS